MTNIIVPAVIGKADEGKAFIYYSKIECYFKDRSKRLFEFYKQQTKKSLQESMKIGVMQLVLTWTKDFIKKPGGDFERMTECLPTLRYGYHTEPCYI